VLTDARCRAAKATGKRYQISDGKVRGLVLRVAADGQKSWSLLYYFGKRRRRYPIGVEVHVG
jgi:hypothetical protein